MQCQSCQCTALFITSVLSCLQVVFKSTRCLAISAARCVSLRNHELLVLRVVSWLSCEGLTKPEWGRVRSPRNPAPARSRAREVHSVKAALRMAEVTGPGAEVTDRQSFICHWRQTGLRNPREHGKPAMGDGGAWGDGPCIRAMSPSPCALRLVLVQSFKLPEPEPEPEAFDLQQRVER